MSLSTRNYHVYEHLRQDIIWPRMREIFFHAARKSNITELSFTLPALPDCIHTLAKNDQYNELEAWWRRRVHEYLVVHQLYKINNASLDDKGEWVFPNNIRYTESLDVLAGLA